MLKIFFIVAYMASIILFAYGLSTLPQQNTNGSHKSADEVTAEYRAAVLSSNAFKEVVIGVGMLILLVILNIVYRCIYDRVEPEVLPVQIMPKALRRAQPQPVTEHTIIDLKPMFPGPHITLVPKLDPKVTGKC